MKPTGTLVLTRRDVVSLLTIEESIAAVERVFKMYGEGETSPPGVLGVHVQDGGFHIKAGVLKLDRAYFAAKINANFPLNPTRLRTADNPGRDCLAGCQQRLSFGVDGFN
jgi:ornithine cyclodeaminase/alanine dehydrogenase-like protein (mu-crystallin family)